MGMREKKLVGYEATSHADIQSEKRDEKDREDGHRWGERNRERESCEDVKEGCVATTNIKARRGCLHEGGCLP